MNAAIALTLVRMGGRPCAIPCEHVVEVVPRVLLGHLPDAAPQVLGVINLRGDVVPVVDVRSKLAGTGELPTPAYQHLVIVRAGARQIGLAVDEVTDVRDVAAGAIERPSGVAGRPGPGIVRVDSDLVLVLSAEDVLHAIR